MLLLLFTRYKVSPESFWLEIQNNNLKLNIVKEGDMGGGPEHRNTAKKINKHCITARKVDGTPSPQQLFFSYMILTSTLDVILLYLNSFGQNKI